MIPLTTWTQPDPVNVLINLGSSVDQQDQYRELSYALLTAIRALPGATRLQESNGTTASSAQNINSAADIVFAAAGSAHSWALYELASGETITLDFVNAAADPTPQLVNIYKSTSAYAAGSTTGRPAAITVGRENSALAFNIVPWAAVVAGQYTWLRTAEGSLYFLVKQQGVGAFYSTFFIHRSGTSRGNFSIAFYAASNASADVLIAANLASTGNWRTSQEDGTASNTGQASSNAFPWTSWNNGQDSTGNVPRFGVVVGCNLVASPRYLGAMTDVVGIPGGSPINAQDPLDVSGTHRLRSFGDLMFPLLVGSGDI